MKYAVQAYCTHWRGHLDLDSIDECIHCAGTYSQPIPLTEFYPIRKVYTDEEYASEFG